MFGIVCLLGALLAPDDAVAGPSPERLAELKAHPFHGYNIIIQIDKAAPGKSLHAQRVRVHRYYPDTQSVAFVSRWDASTGAETPKEDVKGRLAKRQTHAGYYNVEFLDIDAYSRSWDGPMPYAVYWDYNQGFAIHATEWFNYFKLGRRASAGCTRLHERHATELYAMIDSMGKAWTYKLDRNSGEPVRDANGNPVVHWSYQAMVLIEDGGVMEPTRFGFLHRDVVFTSSSSYQDFMHPPDSVAPNRTTPAMGVPAISLKQRNGAGAEHSGFEGMTPLPETGTGQPGGNPPDGDPMDVENVLLENDTNDTQLARERPDSVSVR